MLGKIIRFLKEYGSPVGYLKHYGAILQDYGRAWDRCDIEAILGHFSESFLYTDQLNKEPLKNKAEMRSYLEKYFAAFPIQSWTKNTMLYPHYSLGKFAVAYDFAFGRENRMNSGTGMESYVFRGDKIIEAHLHLNFNGLEIAEFLGYRP